MFGRPMLVMLVSFAILALAAGAGYAEVASATAIEEAIAPHASGGATGACSNHYYNFCKWLWVWTRWDRGDEAGVIFDLPTDCAKVPGEECWNTGFWWYWRYTQPGRWNCSISYKLYELDSQGCKASSPLATLAHQEPTERWNHYAGLGGPITSDHVAIIATWDNVYYPWMATDNNVNDLADPTNCPGYVPHAFTRSVLWVDSLNTNCPPVPYADPAGPVEIIMDASFECHTVATKNESWTGVKKLFR